MQIQKMPLEDRLARRKNGHSAYPEYIPCVLRSFASMPVSDYLAEFGDDQWEKLCRILRITENKDRITYQEVAAIIWQRGKQNQWNLEIVEALFILFLPFRSYN